MSEQTSHDPNDVGESEPLHDPAHERSGENVDEAVATAEEGSQVEGVHHAPGTLEPGESRIEKMADVVDGDREDES